MVAMISATVAATLSMAVGVIKSSLDSSIASPATILVAVSFAPLGLYRNIGQRRSLCCARSSITNVYGITMPCHEKYTYMDTYAFRETTVPWSHRRDTLFMLPCHIKFYKYPSRRGINYNLSPALL